MLQVFSDYINMEKAEDDWVVVECPALPGCISHGKAEKEALENIKEAIIASFFILQ